MHKINISLTPEELADILYTPDFIGIDWLYDFIEDHVDEAGRKFFEAQAQLDEFWSEEDKKEYGWLSEFFKNKELQ